MHITFSLTQSVIIWLKVENELWRTKKRTGLNTKRERERGKQDKDQETEWGSALTDRQAEEEERLVEKKTPNVILHSLHGAQGRGVWERKPEEKRGRNGGKGERGKEEEGDKLKFNLAPDSISIPTSQRHSHKISTLCKWHRSTFGDFPSSEIRWDICPPPPLPGSSMEADSQI